MKGNNCHKAPQGAELIGFPSPNQDIPRQSVSDFNPAKGSSM